MERDGGKEEETEGWGRVNASRWRACARFDGRLSPQSA